MRIEVHKENYEKPERAEEVSMNEESDTEQVMLRYHI